MAKFRVQGESRLKRKLRKFPKEVTAELAKAIEQGANELRTEMEVRAPKDTGRMSLAATAVLSKDRLAARVGYSRDQPGFKRAWRSQHGFIALFKEFGTKGQPAEPFIRPAYRAKLASILDRIDGAVSGVLRKASSGNF